MTSTTIALAGKGGVGKTTIAAMVVKYLSDTQSGNILAIDADPSSNLNMVLGLELEWTVGDIREDMLKQVKDSLLAGGAAMGALPGGMNKRDHLNYEIRSALSEGQRVDLIAMGRSEGPGCYCAVNHNLREVIDTIGKNYRYTVIDNEAGIEHLSRRTTRDVDHLFIVSDPTQRGIYAAQRILKFTEELDIKIDQAYLILNRVPEETPQALLALVEKQEIPLLGMVPQDQNVAEFDISGEPLVNLNSNSPVFQAVAALMEQVLISQSAA